MKKLSKYLLVCFSLFLANCNKNQTNQEPLVKKGEGIIYNYSNHPGISFKEFFSNEILKATGNFSARPEGICSIGWYLSNYTVSYNCATSRYTLKYEVWIIAYNYFNANLPTNVKARNGLNSTTFYYPVNTITPYYNSPHVAYQYFFDIDLGTQCPSGSISLYFDATATNCGTTQNMSSQHLNLSFPIAPCSSNISYSCGAFQNGNRTIRFERLSLLCGQCSTYPTTLAYEYRIKGSTGAFSTVTSSTPSSFIAVTPPLSPGTYEYRCQGRCTGTSPSGYSVIQPGVNEITIQ